MMKIRINLNKQHDPIPQVGDRFYQSRDLTTWKVVTRTFQGSIDSINDVVYVPYIVLGVELDEQVPQ